MLHYLRPSQFENSFLILKKKSFVSFYTYAAIDRTDLVIPEVVDLTFENRLSAVGDCHVLHDGREVGVKGLWERESHVKLNSRVHQDHLSNHHKDIFFGKGLFFLDKRKC